MKLPSYLSVIGLCLATSSLISAQPTTQSSSAGGADEVRLQQVRNAFQLNWKAYKQYAFGHDIISPIAKAGVDNGNLAGFKGTLVESLSTFIVMGLADTPEYKELLDMVSKIDFTTTTQGVTTPGEVSIFQMTVTYIGALTSAYHLHGEKKEEEFLLKQAQTLADGLAGAWYQKNKIPFSTVNLNTKQPQHLDQDVNLAEAGTLTMEWGMLSKLSGDPKYVNLATGSVDAVIGSKPYFPSLWATRIWPQNATASSTYITTGGGCDSLIEYLIKYPVLLNDKNHKYAQTYGKLVETLQKELVSKTGVNNLTFIADYNIDKKEPNYVGSHPASMLAGNIAYAGRLLGRDDWTTLGLEMTESYYQSYRAAELGIGGYGIGWFDQNQEAKGWGWVNDARRKFYNKNGLFIHVGIWVQGPEMIESLFYAWRITRDEKFRDMAWEAFQQIKKQASTETAYAGIQNVNDPSTNLFDETESYLYGELFKYLYLIFSDPKEYSLDEFVFTAHGHLFKRGAASAESKSASNSWGSVQGQAFPYKSLMDGTAKGYKAGNVATSALETETLGQVKLQTVEKPQFVKEVNGDGKAQHVMALSSQLGIKKNVANDLLTYLPEKPIIKPRTIVTP